MLNKNIKFWGAIVLFLLYMVICFFMPTIINGDFSDAELEKIASGEKIIFSTNDKIKLMLSETNSVVEMNFEDYIKGVLIGEMPITYELEALKAQAVVARTYTLYKLKYAEVKHENGADMCDDINCCQAYKTKEYAFASWDDEEENSKWAKLETAVNSTSGEVIKYDGKIINAFFHANSGGKTEDVKYLWAKQEMPYLLSVSGNEEDLREENKIFSKEEFKNLIVSKIPNYTADSKIVIKDYTESGRVRNLEIAGTNIEATALRSLIGIKSTNFKLMESGDSIIFNTIGYGHGVGMSQDGANKMAKDGANYVDIIKHYYSGVTISKT